MNIPLPRPSFISSTGEIDDHFEREEALIFFVFPYVMNSSKPRELRTMRVIRIERLNPFELL